MAYVNVAVGVLLILEGATEASRVDFWFAATLIGAGVAVIAGTVFLGSFRRVPTGHTAQIEGRTYTSGLHFVPRVSFFGADALVVPSVPSPSYAGSDKERQDKLEAEYRSFAVRSNWTDPEKVDLEIRRLQREVRRSDIHRLDFEFSHRKLDYLEHRKREFIPKKQPPPPPPGPPTIEQIIAEIEGKAQTLEAFMKLREDLLARYAARLASKDKTDMAFTNALHRLLDQERKRIMREVNDDD
jgi:hypothetical protein